MLRKEQCASPFSAVLFSIMSVEKISEYFREEWLSLSCPRGIKPINYTSPRNQYELCNFLVSNNDITGDPVLQIILQNNYSTNGQGGKVPKIRTSLSNKQSTISNRNHQRKGGIFFVLRLITFVIIIRLCENTGPV